MTFQKILAAKGVNRRARLLKQGWSELANPKLGRESSAILGALSYLLVDVSLEYIMVMNVMPLSILL